MAQAVLITGCSSGIGRATAERLAGRGFTVYATARKVASIADLEARGCRVLALDVTEEDSMRGAVETVVAEHGAVHALVNNAGYSQSGAIEEVPIADVRRQFETNVFGLVRMCQLVLPGMRARGAGRIVNVSSMGRTSRSRAAATTTRRSTRSRRSATRCASRSRASGSRVVSCSPA